MLLIISKNNKGFPFNATLPKKGMHAHQRSRLLTCAIALVLTIGIAGEALATPTGVSITKIAETNQICPSDIQCFFDSFGSPAINSNKVAFYSRLRYSPYAYASDGIFTSLDSSISTIKIATCLTPGSCQGLGAEPSLSAGTLAFFQYSGTVSRQYNLIVGSNGVFKTAFTYRCNPAYCETSFGNPSVSEGFVAFNINSSVVGRAGIYIYDNVAGSLPFVVVTTEYSVPGGSGTFTSFGGQSISGNFVAFVGTGSNSEKGIYTQDINAKGIDPLGFIVDNNTSIPGGTGNFNAFGTPSLSGNIVAFLGSDSNGLQGIYTGGIRGALNIVADTSTLIPGRTSKFKSFGDPVLSGNWVAFFGADSNGGEGIYLDRLDVKHNSMLKVFGTSDELDGKTITGLSFGHGGLSEDKQLAFVANFTDGSSGVYKAKIATTKDQCKNSGWKAFGFKNQGQCIQFVTTRNEHDNGDKVHK
jgi:hypothetical protein